MEKMLRKKKDNSDYEIDRELTGKFAIEKNAEYQDKIAQLEEENGLLKQCLDKLMFDADVVNVKIHGEIGDYVYVRSDKQFKLNVKE